MNGILSSRYEEIIIIITIIAPRADFVSFCYCCSLFLLFSERAGGGIGQRENPTMIEDYSENEARGNGMK